MKIWLLTKTAHHSPKLELLIKNRGKEYKKKTTKPRLLQEYSKPFLGHSAGMSHRGIRGLRRSWWDSTCPACAGSWVKNGLFQQGYKMEGCGITPLWGSCSRRCMGHAGQRIQTVQSLARRSLWVLTASAAVTGEEVRRQTGHTSVGFSLRGHWSHWVVVTYQPVF